MSVFPGLPAPQVAPPEELPFTPLYLLSASEAVTYQRRHCRGAGPAADEEEAPAGTNWTYVYVPGTGIRTKIRFDDVWLLYSSACMVTRIGNTHWHW